MPVTPTNRWAIGEMYGGGLLNGNPFYVQPLGAGTPVYPRQKDAAQWDEYPVPGLVIQEYSPIWSPGCGHSIKFPKLIPEFDYTTNTTIMLIACSICGYVQRVITPIDETYNPIENAIIIL